VKQDLLYEAWVMLAYNNPRPVLTSSERGRINRGLKELREIGATPQELKAKWGAYKAKWAKLGNPSITALTGNWNTLGTRISTPQASKRPSYLDTPSPTPEGLKHAQELLPPALRKRLEAKHQ
jgi:hypothetical protein